MAIRDFPGCRPVHARLAIRDDSKTEANERSIRRKSGRNRKTEWKRRNPRNRMIPTVSRVPIRAENTSLRLASSLTLTPVYVLPFLAITCAQYLAQYLGVSHGLLRALTGMEHIAIIAPEGSIVFEPCAGRRHLSGGSDPTEPVPHPPPAYTQDPHGRTLIVR